jgi:cation diffusion facilitator family transporter
MEDKGSKVLIIALAANVGIAIAKFVAAAITGSSAMLTEGVHSLVDSTNQLLLMYGQKRAAKPADAMHPAGYGRELYFWSFVVALLMFTTGAGVASYEGVLHMLHPEPIENPLISYVVYGAAALFEGTSWAVALREFRKAKGGMGYFEAVRHSKDPPTFIVLFEDSAALLGLAIAALGTFAAEALSMPVLDGAASLGISVLLGLTALALARESKGLLMGEPASREVRQSIVKIMRNMPQIENHQIAFTVHLSPEEIVVALALEFRDDLTAPEIEKATRDLESAIHAAQPEVVAIFVKPQTAAAQRANPFGRLGGAPRRISGLAGEMPSSSF